MAIGRQSSGLLSQLLKVPTINVGVLTEASAFESFFIRKFVDE
jgi:hypothetical protein